MFWLLVAISAVVVWATLFAFPDSRDWWTEKDNRLLFEIADLRTDAGTRVMRALHALGSIWVIRPLRWGLIIALVVLKRWRHLFAAVGAMVASGWLVVRLAESVGRPRPFVEILAPWQGYAHPSGPVTAISLTLTAIGLSLFPSGTWRRRWFMASAAMITLLVAARVYLGVDHLSDGVVSATIGVAIPVIVFKLWVPEAVFPVSYRRARAAHLDISGARGDAIRTAVQDQLGFEVKDIELFGLEASGGSTPMRLLVDCSPGPDCWLFAKLYARSHLRSDRWYKLGRTILYGSLEDEVTFRSVRRLVEYEDYMLLLMRKAGIPSAETFGFVEITPEREYLIVTEFLEGAREIGDPDLELTDDIIDDALLAIRKLWDAGIAHRDVKPANVMVVDGKVSLIDVAFGTVRPTPWRQAVDLANMMIVLALRSTPEHVYERALRFFAPDDIAEAFAATRGVTIPSQSRSMLAAYRKEKVIDIVKEFQDITPYREPIAIQRWSTRRLGLTAGALVVGLFFVSLIIDNIRGQGYI